MEAPQNPIGALKSAALLGLKVTEITVKIPIDVAVSTTKGTVIVGRVIVDAIKPN
jgi:hypothetical protein